jgi:hypothetical protein
MINRASILDSQLPGHARRVALVALCIIIKNWPFYGTPKSRKPSPPPGKVRQAFDAVSKLPRKQQEKIVDVINALVAQAANP